MTLRETIQAEIANAEAELQAKKDSLAALEQSAGGWLGHEVDALKAFFTSIAGHLGL
jgi:hypothetical protein